MLVHRRSGGPQLVGRWHITSLVTALAVASDCRTVAVAFGDRLEFHDGEQGDLLPEGEFRVPGAPIFALSFAPDGRILASGGGGDNAVRIWGLTGCEVVLRHTLTGYADHWVRGLAYAADGATLLSVDTQGRVLAWDRDGHQLGETSTAQLPCRQATLGAGGQLILTKPDWDNSVHVSRLLKSGWH